MRSLGRPNREQVVTTRSDVLTTLRGPRPVQRPGLQRHPGPRRGRPARNRCRRPRPTSWPTRFTCGRWAIGRTADELAAARELVGSPPTPEGLADLLWVVFVLPEFQLIR